MNTPTYVSWEQDGTTHKAVFSSSNAAKPPTRIQVVDDTLTAHDAHKMAAQGIGMLWRGDYHNARQLLSAMGRRAPDTGKPKRLRAQESTAERFYKYRQARTQRSRMLSMLMVPVEPGAVIALRRAPDITEAWHNAFGEVTETTVVTLQELLGAIGAQQWRANGLFVPALDAKIHPHYGTFAPVRGEYLDLVAQAQLPATDTAFDIGTGTGVLAAILAKRGVQSVIGTDSQARAIECAKETFASLALTERASAVQCDMFPPGRASLIVCNPPWLPGTPQTLLDYAVYDPKSRMLREFLRGLPEHLNPGGEGWLVISDLAERLGLRSREELLGWIADAGLEVLGRSDTRPTHSRSADTNDPFHAERSAEITSLWKLGVRG